MGLTDLLVRLGGGPVGRAAADRMGAALIGSPTERAIESAIRNACDVIAATHSSSPEFAASALRELVIGSSPNRVHAGTAWTQLTSTVDEALGGLWEEERDGEGHAAALGLDCGRTDLTSLLSNEIVRSIGLQAEAASPMGLLYVVLQVERNRSDIDALLGRTSPEPIPRDSMGGQVQHVSTWVSIHGEVPTVYVMNDSDLPITDVRVTPALVAFDAAGAVIAQVGHATLTPCQQVDPHSGWAWPLEHCRSWANQGAVRGQVHASFSDARGDSWSLAHDHLTRRISS